MINSCNSKVISLLRQNVMLLCKYERTLECNLNCFNSDPPYKKEETRFPILCSKLIQQYCLRKKCVFFQETRDALLKYVIQKGNNCCTHYPFYLASQYNVILPFLLKLKTRTVFLQVHSISFLVKVFKSKLPVKLNNIYLSQNHKKYCVSNLQCILINVLGL